MLRKYFALRSYDRTCLLLTLLFFTGFCTVYLEFQRGAFGIVMREWMDCRLRVSTYTYVASYLYYVSFLTFATYKLFVYTRDQLLCSNLFNTDDSIANVLNRRSDILAISSMEYMNFYASQILPWMIIYYKFQQKLPDQEIVFFCISLCMLSYSFGAYGMTFFLGSITLLLNESSRWSVINKYFLCVIYLVFLSSSWVQVNLTNSTYNTKFLFVALAWLPLKFLSIPRNETRKRLLLRYYLSPPTLVFGPLILFSDFSATVREGNTLPGPKYFLRLLTSASIWLFVPYFLHYCTVLEVAGDRVGVVERLGAIFWSGLVFSFSVKCMYACALSFSGPGSRDVYRLPPCIGPIADYSFLWQTFDKGMHKLLKTHVYSPMKFYGFSSTTSAFMCFVLVLFFHGGKQRTVEWILANFVCSFCRHYINRMVSKQYFEKGSLIHTLLLTPITTISLVVGGLFPTANPYVYQFTTQFITDSTIGVLGVFFTVTVIDSYSNYK